MQKLTWAGLGVVDGIQEGKGCHGQQDPPHPQVGRLVGQVLETRRLGDGFCFVVQICCTASSFYEISSTPVLH